MSEIFFKDNMRFDTDIRGYDLEESGGWTPDCSNKWDYDPAIISLCCRVWGPHQDFITRRTGDSVTIEQPFDPSTTWAASIYCGDDELFVSGFQKADDLESAKRAVEAWAADKAQLIRNAVAFMISSQIADD